MRQSPQQQSFDTDSGGTGVSSDSAMRAMPAIGLSNSPQGGFAVASHPRTKPSIRFADHRASVRNNGDTRATIPSCNEKRQHSSLQIGFELLKNERTARMLPTQR
eukprot:207201-Amphidinium_carterae.1